MKKFLALITCLIMLSVGTIQSKESKIGEQPKIEQLCVDIGEIPQLQIIQFIQAPVLGQMIMDSYTIKQVDKQSIEKQLLQKDALCSQYRLIPDCTIEYISKHKTKYTTHYAYSFCNPYNQPPNK